MIRRLISLSGVPAASRFAAITLLIGMLGFAGCSAAATATTRVSYIAPVTETGELASTYSITSSYRGTCSGSSAVASGGPVYRCATSKFLIDPCWRLQRSTTTLVCLANPYTHEVVEVRSSSVPPHVNGPYLKKDPWGIELASGTKCHAFGGSPDQFKGQFVRFICSGSLSLLDDLNDTKQPWTIQVVRYNIKTNEYSSLGFQKIASVTYAGPGPK